MKFHLTDVFLPNVADLAAFIREAQEEEIEGTVIDFSDSGTRRNAFAVIEVIQKQTVIIPVEKLEPADSPMKRDRIQ